MFFLIKKEPSAFVNPTKQLLKKGKLRYPEAVLGNSKVVGISPRTPLCILSNNFISFLKINIARSNWDLLV